MVKMFSHDRSYLRREKRRFCLSSATVTNTQSVQQCVDVLVPCRRASGARRARFAPLNTHGVPLSRTSLIHRWWMTWSTNSSATVSTGGSTAPSRCPKRMVSSTCWETCAADPLCTGAVYSSESCPANSSDTGSLSIEYVDEIFNFPGWCSVSVVGFITSDCLAERASKA